MTLHNGKCGERLTMEQENKTNEFKPIETQEQLDGIIKDRLARAEKQAAKQYEGYTSPEDLKALKDTHKQELADLTDKYTKELDKFKDVEQQLKEKDDKIHQYEVSSVKSSVARELNIPFEAIEFLQGEDEKAIRESAEKLKAVTGGASHYVAPTKDREETDEDTVTKAYRDVLNQLKGQ